MFLSGGQTLFTLREKKKVKQNGSWTVENVLYLKIIAIVVMGGLDLSLCSSRSLPKQV